jgi:hypothetical protein
MGDRITLTPGSHGQVSEITGAHTKACQLRVLRQQGIRHWLNAAGWPVVPLSAVDGLPAPTDAPGWRSRAYDAA